MPKKTKKTQPKSDTKKTVVEKTPQVATVKSSSNTRTKPKSSSEKPLVTPPPLEEKESTKDSQDSQPEKNAPTDTPRASTIVEKVPPIVVETQHNVNRRRILLVGIGLFVTVVVTSSILVLSKFSNRESQRQEPTPMPTSTTTPTPIGLSPEDWTFDVLNGSEIGGIARSTAEKLMAEGYTVVTIGNAEATSSTQLFVSSSMKQHADSLLSLISKIVPTATLAGTLTEGTASARLVIGSEGL